MATQPEFSIILCTRNRAELLSDALEGLCAIDYPLDDVELVLVDNGSTDGTRELVEKRAREFPFALRYVPRTEARAQRGTQRGIAEARGRFLLFTTTISWSIAASSGSSPGSGPATARA